MFSSGDTIDKHNDKFRQADAKLREVFGGDNIKIDDLIKVWYVASLDIFEVFRSNVEHIVTVYDESNFNELMDYMSTAKASSKSISIPEDQQAAAVIKLLRKLGVKTQTAGEKKKALARV